VEEDSLAEHGRSPGKSKRLTAKELEAFQAMSAFFVHDLKNAATLPASPSISVFQFLASRLESVAIVSHPLQPD
jgi:hypothetical protein